VTLRPSDQNVSIDSVSSETNSSGEAAFLVSSPSAHVVEFLGSVEDNPLTQSLEVFFSSFGPPQSMKVPFLLPTTGIETLKDYPFQTLTPHDANSGETYTFALVGDLPNGLSFDSSIGSISGTPSITGVTALQICQAEDGVATSKCQHLRISVVEETQIENAVSIDPGACAASVGVGTNSDPIRISSISELVHCVHSYPDRAFRLNADLDFSGQQIDSLRDFSGIFDGDNHQLRNWAANNHGPLFKSLIDGAVVKNLKLIDFSVNSGSGSGILTSLMAGAIVHHLTIANSGISGGSGIGAVTGAVLRSANPKGSHGFIDQVRFESVTITADETWATAGLAVGYLAHTPFRVSNVSVRGVTTLTGGNALGVIVGRGEGAVDGLNQGNLWLDTIAVEAEVFVEGGAFASGMVGMGIEGDTISNSYSFAHVTSDNIGGTGIVGTVMNDATKGSPELIANTYFAGTLSGAGVLVGSNYRSGKSIAVHNFVLRDFGLRMDGSGNMISDSTRIISDTEFRNPTFGGFKMWQDRFSPPWIFSAGSYPQLTVP
jgi:hypothetical protein